MNLSKSQLAIYEMDRYVGGSISNIFSSIIFDNEYDIEKMRVICQKCIDANPMHRAKIYLEKGVPQQKIVESLKVDIEVKMFESREACEEWVEKESRISLDIFGSLSTYWVCVIQGVGIGIFGKHHHIISDAVSFGVIADHLKRLYEGEEVEGYSYFEYLEKEQSYLSSEKYEKDKSYWLSVYDENNEVNLLSTKQDSEYIGNRITKIIPNEISKAINIFCENIGCSPYIFFLTISSIYYQRLTGKDSFYLGTPVKNRAGRREKNTLGAFINTIPLLICFDENETFFSLAEKLKYQVAKCFRHQKYLYSEMIKMLREEREFSGALFDTVVSFQNIEIGENETHWYYQGMQAESLQIHIDDRDLLTSYRVNYDFQVSKFQGQDIEALHDNLVTLILSVIMGKEYRIPDLECVSAGGKETLLNKFNQSKILYNQEKTICDYFEEQVASQGHQEAIVACDRTLTYKELNEESNRVANELIRQGVSNNDLVAFMLPRKSYLFSVILGILKSGAAYLPIDPKHPQERIEYMLADSNAKLCITEKNVEQFLKGENSVNPQIEIDKEDICYCIYTSGSTGKPKGTLLNHMPVANFCKNLLLEMGIHDIQSIVATTTAGFDIFVTESLLPLVNGFTVILADEEQSIIQNELNELLQSKEVDLLQTTPSKMKMLISDGNKNQYLKKLEYIFLAGEPLEESLVRKIREYTTAKIYNMYGPTETTVYSTGTLVSGNEITIGKPIANTQIYILDKYKNLLPVGAVGELCIAGDGVGKGYLNRTELTKEKFVDNPFGAGKMYKTGDLAKWNQDGTIDFIGRNDFQVKIRGLRIELGEIENVLEGHEEINQAVVVVQKDEEERQYICAFYIGEKELSQKVLRLYMGESMPQYMIPHIFKKLDKLPQTGSGKVDRNALPKVKIENEESEDWIPPSTNHEKKLAVLWETILRCDNIGKRSNFFEIGGDSLKAISLVNQIHDTFGITIEARMIFEKPMLEELAIEIKSRKQSSLDTIAKAEKRKYYPITPPQRRIYLASSLENSKLAYNMPACLKLKGKIDVEKLEKSFDKLVELQEAFQTGFLTVDGEIVSFIDSNSKIKLEKYEEGFVRVFDLAKPPLMHVAIQRVSETENNLYFDMHHIISDGMSLQLMVNCLNDIYNGKVVEKQELEYTDYAIHISNEMKKGSYEIHKKKWNQLLQGHTALEFPTEFKRPNKQTFEGAVIQNQIEKTYINKIIQKLNVSPYIFFKATYDILLSRYSNKEDIIVGSAHLGRENPQLLKIVGMFVNSLILRGKPQGEKTFQEYVEEVKGNFLEALSVAEYPFENIVQDLSVTKDMSRNPIFDTMINYQNVGVPTVAFDGIETEIEFLDSDISKFDFSLDIFQSEKAYELRFQYNTKLFTETFARGILENYVSLITEVIKDSHRKINEYGSVANKQILLEEFNQTEIIYDQEKTICDYFEEQVASQGNQEAIVACDRTLTYKELNEESNRVANELIRQGVSNNDLVAFMLPRKSYLFSVILGILKSGAAYFPIDPKHPQERIEYMLTDSNAKLCITEKNVGQFLKGKNNANSQIEIDKEDICYCIYTSGSTGKPKGTLLNHMPVANFCKNLLLKMGIHDIQSVIATNTVGFDIFIAESLLPIVNGFTVILADEEQSIIQNELNELLQIKEVDLLLTTPSKMKMLIADGNKNQYLTNIEYIFFGGEPLEESLVRKIREYTTAKIYNIYGPTETTVCSTVTLVSGNEITIGKPIANTQIYILDKYKNLLPMGAVGELCIAGDGVGKGYLNRTELTKEKFVDNPFGAGKMYKTGDLAKWNQDGTIDFIGRNDFQVKIRGLRIELGEIENVLESHEAINQAVVVVQKDEEERQYICGFYTGEKDLDSKELRTYLEESLPKYMVPHIFKKLNQFPQTGSGKVDRNAFPKVSIENLNVEYVVPKTGLEKELAILMEKVLNITQVGATDSFFDLGGDSLKAMEFTAKAHEIGIFFNLQAIFDNPTARQLRQYIEEGESSSNSYNHLDFEKYEDILSKNTYPETMSKKVEPIGDVLITGVTGFLGIHVLAEYLENQTGKSYCLVRGETLEESITKLKELLEYYFDKKYNALINQRIIVLQGDITQDNLGLKEIPEVDMIIHSAASVKHYGSYKYFQDVNVIGTQNVVKVAARKGARLIHISTLSVSGNTMVDQFDMYKSEEHKDFFESNLYIEQPLDNVYIRSKFEGEMVVLDAMLEGLAANIIRVGNLTNRKSDLKFQRNYKENAFLSRVKALLELGYIPDYLLTQYAEFSPVDDTAKAIMTIAKHFSTEHTVFHVNSPKVLYFDKMVEYVRKAKINLKVVDGEEFTKVLKAIFAQGEKYIYEALINDMDDDSNLVYDSNISIKNDYTTWYLKQLGFEWCEIDFWYANKYIEYFREIGYLKV